MVHYNLNVQLRCHRVNNSKIITELTAMCTAVGKWQKPTYQPFGVTPVCRIVTKGQNILIKTDCNYGSKPCILRFTNLQTLLYIT